MISLKAQAYWTSPLNIGVPPVQKPFTLSTTLNTNILSNISICKCKKAVFVKFCHIGAQRHHLRLGSLFSVLKLITQSNMSFIEPLLIFKPDKGSG